MRFLKRLLAGAAIGIASAIAGVSGGTVAIILKVYDEIIESISHIFSNFKKSFLTLLPILLGVIIALVPCVLLLQKALDGFIFGTVCLFAGLVIGSFPSIKDEVKDVKITPKLNITLIITCVIALTLGILSVVFGGKLDLTTHINKPEGWFYIIIILIGIVGSIALVVPGISGSMILLILGFYKPLINLVSNWIKGEGIASTGVVFAVLGCFLLGVLIGLFVVSKIMNVLLSKYRETTFFGIIGFIIGSTITLFFNYDIYTYYQNWCNGNYVAMPCYIEIPIGIILLIGGAILSYQLVKILRKRQLENKKSEN